MWIASGVITDGLWFQIRGFPTIKMFPAGKKDGEAEDYDGGRTASDIISWAREKLAENVPAPDVYEASLFVCVCVCACMHACVCDRV